MQHDFNQVLNEINDKNSILEETAENMRLSILGKETKGKDERTLDVVESYVNENKAELVNPLDILQKIEELRQKRMQLQKELETQIKVSNATTFITIS